MMTEKNFVLNRLKEYVNRLEELMKWHNPLNINTRIFKVAESLKFSKEVAADVKELRVEINRLGKHLKHGILQKVIL